jgi:hypothetical protein
MAMTRKEFERLEIARHWRGTVSDDYKLSAVVRAAGLRIDFAPRALSLDASSIGGREFLAWARRQMILTRVHRPDLWWLSLAAHIIYCGGMVASLAGGYYLVLAAQLAIGAWKGYQRARLAGRIHPDWLAKLDWSHAWMTPLATWIWLFALVFSAGQRRIRWHGRVYELRF